MSEVPDPIVETGTVTTDVTTGSTTSIPAGSEHQHAPVDLDVVEHDLDGVEAALRRLDDGTYWFDEVTGRPIPDEVLAADPVARRGP